MSPKQQVLAQRLKNAIKDMIAAKHALEEDGCFVEINGGRVIVYPPRERLSIKRERTGEEV